MAHTCHAQECRKVIPDKRFMCKAHWSLLSRDLKLAIWCHSRPGQEEDKQPSKEYLITARKAINEVARQEGKPLLPALEQSPMLALSQFTLW